MSKTIRKGSKMTAKTREVHRHFNTHTKAIEFSLEVARPKNGILLNPDILGEADMTKNAIDFVKYMLIGNIHSKNVKQCLNDYLNACKIRFNILIPVKSLKNLKDEEMLVHITCLRAISCFITLTTV